MAHWIKISSLLYWAVTLLLPVPTASAEVPPPACSLRGPATPPLPSGCSPTLEEVATFLERSPPPRVVDLRPEPHYQAIHAFGAINLPPFAVPSHGSLRTAPVLLYGHAGSRSAVEQTCVAMKAAGFSEVTILPRGLLDWIRLNRPLEGSAGAVDAERAMSVTQLFSEYFAGPWTLLDVAETSVRNAPRSFGPFGAIVALPLPKISGSGDDAWVASLRSELSKARASDPRSTVALLPAGVDSVRETQRLVALLKRIGDPGVFVIEGGSRAIETYLNQNKQLAAALQKQPTGKGCGHI